MSGGVRVRIAFLTDADIRRNCECIFDARTSNAGGVNRAKIFAKLYDSKVFGVNPYDSSVGSPSLTCSTCKQSILQCPNRPAYVELGFDYVVPLFVDKFYSLVTRALPPGVPRSKIVTHRKALHNSDQYAMFMESVRKRFPVEYARYTSSVLLVRPPCTRPEYMRERNMQQISMGAIGGTTKRRTVYRLCDYYPIINKLIAYCNNPTLLGKRKIISMIYAMTMRTTNNGSCGGGGGGAGGGSSSSSSSAAAAAAAAAATTASPPPQHQQQVVSVAPVALTTTNALTVAARGAKQSLLDTLSHKKGVLRQQCSGVRPTFTVRGVIVCKADLCAWNVAVPRDAYAYLKGKTVFLCRQPTLYSAGMQLIVPVLHDDDNVDTVLGVTHELSGSFNQDYDGDEMTLYGFHGESADAVLNALPILLYSELNGIELLRCSYNAVLAIYVLTKWPASVLPDGTAYRDFFETRVLLPWFDSSTTDDRRNVELIRAYMRARGNATRPWVKKDVLEWDAFVLRMLKGREELYIRNRRSASVACDAFMTWATPPVTSEEFDLANRKFVREYGAAPASFDSALDMAAYWHRVTSTVVSKILSEHSALAIMINSNAKGSAMHAVQAVGCIGPVIVNYYATDFSQLCRRFGMAVFSNEQSAFAWVPQNLWTGLDPRQHFVVACNTIENMVRSIVNTSEGGYWRRSMQFTLDALSVDETYCVNDRDGRIADFMPPVFNVRAMVAFMCARMFALFSEQVFAATETFECALKVAVAGGDVVLVNEQNAFFTNEDGLLVRFVRFR